MEIRNWRTGEVIYQAKVNTLKELVEKAVKEGVSLKCAYLKNTDLRKADLSCADLYGADLRGADLSGSYLYGTDLSCADLGGADLSNAKLRDTCLVNADLSDAKNVPDSIPMVCPKEGSFVGWKKVKNKLVKLEIPEDAKRSSATTNKCRCSKAKVLEITNLDGSNPIDEVTNFNYSTTTYRVGEMVYPDSFDDDRWNECSNGIHFFMDKQDAIYY